MLAVHGQLLVILHHASLEEARPLQPQQLLRPRRLRLQTQGYALTAVRWDTPASFTATETLINYMQRLTIARMTSGQRSW